MDTSIEGAEKYCLEVIIQSKHPVPLLASSFHEMKVLRCDAAKSERLEGNPRRKEMAQNKAGRAN